jgi:hypothetical protein
MVRDTIVHGSHGLPTAATMPPLSAAAKASKALFLDNRLDN